MNGRVSLAIALALLFCTVGSHASQCNKWRLGGSYSQFTDSGTLDRLGGAWGVIGEYSFYDALQEDMDQITGDVSVFVYYRRYDNSFRGVDFTNNYTSIGLRWRGGRGALPSCDGFYGGVGVACAIVRISPSMDILSNTESATKLEWSALLGVNFAGRLYTEVGYTQTPDLSDFGFGSLTVTAGLRF